MVVGGEEGEDFSLDFSTFVKMTTLTIRLPNNIVLSFSLRVEVTVRRQSTVPVQCSCSVHSYSAEESDDKISKKIYY